MREYKVTMGGQGGLSRRRLLQGAGVLGVWGLGLAAGCGALRFDIGQAVPEQRITGSVLGALLASFIPTPFSLNINLAQRDAGARHRTGAVGGTEGAELSPHQHSKPAPQQRQLRLRRSHRDLCREHEVGNQPDQAEGR